MSNLPLSNQVRPDATLEELKLTKQGWLDMARQAGYPEICWQIVRWLGTPTNQRITRGKPVLWEKHGIAIYGNEYAFGFNPREDNWEYTRIVSAFVRVPESKTRAFSALDEIILNSNEVLCWSWSVFYDKETHEERSFESVGNDNYFVNGSWILSVRDFIGQAQAAKEAHNLANTDLERKRLLEEMLVGVAV